MTTATMKRTNAVKDAAASGKRIRGVHLTFAAPAVIEVLAAVDLQFVYVDGEHGCFDWRDIEAACIAAERHDLTPIARVPDGSEATITRFLDRGIRGIVAPHIESVDDAQRVIASTYFGPLGHRSYGAGRPEYGQRIESKPIHMQACNASVSLCLMIESAAGLGRCGRSRGAAGRGLPELRPDGPGAINGPYGKPRTCRREGCSGRRKRSHSRGRQTSPRGLHEFHLGKRSSANRGAHAARRAVNRNPDKDDLPDCGVSTRKA